MNPETFEYEQSLISKSPIPPLTESNIRDKRMYEAWNDTDKGYAGYVND